MPQIRVSSNDLDQGNRKFVVNVRAFKEKEERRAHHQMLSPRVVNKRVRAWAR